MLGKFILDVERGAVHGLVVVGRRRSDDMWHHLESRKLKCITKRLTLSPTFANDFYIEFSFCLETFSAWELIERDGLNTVCFTDPPTPKCTYMWGQIYKATKAHHCLDWNIFPTKFREIDIIVYMGMDMDSVLSMEWNETLYLRLWF